MNEQKSEIIESEIESNLFQFYINAAKAGNLQLVTTNNYNAVISKPAMWPNYCFNLKYQNNNSCDVINSIVANMRSFNLPPFLVLGTTISEQLASHISQLGMKLTTQWTSMALRIEKEIVCNNTFKIVKATTHNEVHIFIQLVNKWLMNSRSLDANVFLNLLNDKNANMYIAYINNIPVGTSLLFYNNNTAGIYMVAVNGEYRRKGIGKALISKMLSDAFLNGAQLAVLHATKMAEGLYKSFGFEPYGKINVFWLMGKEYI